MTLSDYKDRFGVTYAHVAKLCDVTSSMISAIATRHVRPSLELAIKIERATNNQVPRDNWYPPRPADISITIGGVSL